MQQILTEYKAEEFLEEEGFPVVERMLFVDKDKAFEYAKSIGFPVVLKIASDKILHKTELNAIKLNVDENNFFKSFDELRKIKIEKNGIVVQKFLNGKNIIIGLKKDPVFGHIIVAGIGGIFAEIIKNVSFRVTPINKHEALEMLKELKGYNILSGYRGEKVDIKNIIKVILKVSKLAIDHPEITELDLNPLIVNPKYVKVVDARIVFN